MGVMRRPSLSSLFSRLPSPKSKTFQRLRSLGGSMREMVSPGSKDSKTFKQSDEFRKSAPTLGSVLCKWEDKLMEAEDDSRSSDSTPKKVDRKVSVEKSIAALELIQQEMKELQLLIADSERFHDSAELNKTIVSLVSKKQASLVKKLNKIEFQGRSTAETEFFDAMKDKLNSSLNRMTGVRKCSEDEGGPLRSSKVEINDSQCPANLSKGKRKVSLPQWDSRLFDKEEGDLEINETLSDRVVTPPPQPAQVRYTSATPSSKHFVPPEHRHLPRKQRRARVSMGNVSVPEPSPATIQFRLHDAASSHPVQIAALRKDSHRVDIAMVPIEPEHADDVDSAPELTREWSQNMRDFTHVENESVVKNIRLAAQQMNSGAFWRSKSAESRRRSSSTPGQSRV